jgi:uncharacterized RDD family membrane protein YckC
VKCSKCGYLGFESGIRCKNCGFDFSLLSEPEPIQTNESSAGSGHLPIPDSPEWLEKLNQGQEASSSGAAQRTPNVQRFLEHSLPAMPPGDTKPTSSARGPELPLFGPSDDDAPPAQLRAGPRPPLAVRRTPDAARVRALVKEITSSASGDDEPVLRFADVPASALESAESGARLDMAPAGAASKRLAAFVIDLVVLAAIGATVVYLTLRMVDLPFASWRALPRGPMTGFFGLVAFAYISSFTALGGQTIGKMAMGLRVVAVSGAPLGAAAAIRRAVASLVSVTTLGLGFLPALIGPSRLAVHDRLAGTRVVDSREA